MSDINSNDTSSEFELVYVDVGISEKASHMFKSKLGGSSSSYLCCAFNL